MDEIAGRGKKTFKSWGLSIAINAVIALIILSSTEIYYESNDDFAISQEIVAGYPYIGFVNYFLCRTLILIQNLFPNRNIFVVSQIAVSFAAFSVILKIFIKRKKTYSDTFIPIAVCAFFALDHYCSVQFTKTASLLMLAGMLWLADNYIHERKMGIFAAALFFFYLGVSYRQKGMFPSIAFAGIFMSVWLVMNGRGYYKERKPLNEVALIIILAVISLGAYGFDRVSDAVNASTPELKYSRDYQVERVKATDYPLLKYYDKSAEEYAEIGIDKNDITMISRWILDYDGAASLENLKKINDINRQYVGANRSVWRAAKRATKSAFKFLKLLDFNGMHFVIIIIILIYAMVTNKKRVWWYVFFLAALSVAEYTALFYMQRTLYRALYVVDISAAFWMIYAMLISENRMSRALRWISAVLGAVAVLILFVPAAQRLQGSYEHNKAVVEDKALTEYYEAHIDEFFISPTSVMGQPFSYTAPLDIPSSPANAAGTGGWETLTPYKLGLLGKYGVKNPVRDLIDNDKVFFVGSYKVDLITEYYEKWYCEDGERIKFDKVDEVNGTGIYKVIKIKE